MMHWQVPQLLANSALLQEIGTLVGLLGGPSAVLLILGLRYLDVYKNKKASEEPVRNVVEDPHAIPSSPGVHAFAVSTERMLELLTSNQAILTAKLNDIHQQDRRLLDFLKDLCERTDDNKQAIAQVHNRLLDYMLNQKDRDRNPRQS